MNTYHVMRHGHSMANEAGRVVSDPAVGIDGFGLSGTGRREVRHSLASRPMFDPGLRIISSDFLRARQTAEIAHALAGCRHPIRFDSRLRERWFGDHDGGGADAYPGVWARDAVDPSHTDGNVESANAVGHRVRSVLDELERDFDDETFLLVAHGDTLQILLAICAGRPVSAHREIPHLDTAEIRSVTLGRQNPGR